MSHFKVTANSSFAFWLFFWSAAEARMTRMRNISWFPPTSKFPTGRPARPVSSRRPRNSRCAPNSAGPDSYDPKAEQKAFQEAVQGKATGILVSVADPSLLKDDIDRAVAAGIPVITVDSDAPASKRLFFIGTDNYHAGQIGGQRLAKELNGKGNVAVFTIPEQANLKERLRGYRDALEAFPQIKITRVVDMKGDSRVAFDTATEILGQDKKEHTDAFVCLEALAGKEVATVLSQHGGQRQSHPGDGHRRGHPVVDSEGRDRRHHLTEALHDEPISDLRCSTTFTITS